VPVFFFQPRPSLARPGLFPVRSVFPEGLVHSMRSEFFSALIFEERQSRPSLPPGFLSSIISPLGDFPKRSPSVYDVVAGPNPLPPHSRVASREDPFFHDLCSRLGRKTFSRAYPRPRGSAVDYWRNSMYGSRTLKSRQDRLSFLDPFSRS